MTPANLTSQPSRKSVLQSENTAQALSACLTDAIFSRKLQLLPQVNELYELELAYAESKILTDAEIIRNGAYFAKVGDEFTKHFLMCQGEPVRLPQSSSSRLRAFFQTNQFKTGYGTHGLFPYRGKFHPQMIKGILNALGLKPGDTVLDPMMGSGTVLVEASLMGIHSIGFDASPFCQFMTRAKLDGLLLPIEPLKQALKESRKTYEYFEALVGKPRSGSKIRYEADQRPLPFLNEDPSLQDSYGVKEKLSWLKDKKIEEFLLLAYLDSAGYAERSMKKDPFVQFCAVLERYTFVVEKISRVLEGVTHGLGKAEALTGDARKMDLPNSSIDGIIFSPPYSFAIDYLDNDSFHLNHLGVDTDVLRDKMVGLRGRTPKEKYELYKIDMDTVLSECSSVLKPGKFCCVIVGTNNNQLSKVLGVSPDQVQGIDELMIALGDSHNLKCVRKLSRQIVGMGNTMRNEFIVILQKTGDSE